MPKFHIPNLAKLGLANLHLLKHVAPAAEPLGYYTKLLEASVGKDTMTGHWEMMGLHITTPFKTFTETGFPQDLIDELEKRTGRHIIGNKSASGTEILDELAEQEIQNGDLIVYTSADSVLQICGNEETMGVETLYHYCEIARELTMRPEWMVGRVIARPYTGSKKGEFKRTSNRHDYALKPYGKTALDALKEAGLDVISIGKIKDILMVKALHRLINPRAACMAWNRQLRSWSRISTAYASSIWLTLMHCGDIAEIRSAMEKSWSALMSCWELFSISCRRMIY